MKIDGNKCGGENQSPIDLKSSGWPTFEAAIDKFQMLYSNVVNGTMSWSPNTYTSVTKIDH